MNKKVIALSTVFIALVIIFILSKKNDYSRQNTFDPDVLKCDTSEIFQLTIIPAKADSVTFIRKGEEWEIRNNGNIYPASKNDVSNLIKEIGNFKTDHIASELKEDMATYNLTDTIVTKLVARNDAGEILFKLNIGKMSFQSKSGNGMYGMDQRNVDGITYFMMEGEDQILAANSFLGMMVNTPVVSWRDHILCITSPENISAVSVKYIEDSWSIINENKQWMINGSAVDSNKVLGYFNAFRYLGLRDFEDNILPQGESIYSLNVKTKDGKTTEINAYPLNDSTLLVHSSRNLSNFRVSINDPFIQALFVRSESFK